MIDFDFDRLRGIGLTPELAGRARDSALAAAATPFTLVRVSAVHRDAVQLHDGIGERRARVLPRLLRSGADALAVGDWVLAAGIGDDATWVHGRVAPTSHIARRDADGSRHPVASNVDRALVVMGLDDDFNLRRLERYLALVDASGVASLVVLSKVDLLADDPAQRDQRIAAARRRIAERVEVVAVDATDPRTATALAHVLGFGQTLVVLGSSGAGKSTLTNTLLGAQVQDTGTVRASDGRGMHTTTARTLHRLPAGGCIVDTPGLRTLRPDGDADALGASFADVATLAERCRFRDCAHDGEPGCAVRDGVDPDRLRNFRKMLRESRRAAPTWLDRRRQLAVWKSRGREGHARLKMKRGDG